MNYDPASLNVEIDRLQASAELEEALRELYTYLKKGEPLGAAFAQVWEENLELLYEP